MDTDQMINDAINDMNTNCLNCGVSVVHGQFGTVKLIAFRDGSKHWTMNDRSTSKDRIDKLMSGVSSWPQQH